MAGGSVLEIRLLGGLDVLREGAAVQLPRSRKARALLAYLAATARPHTREALCDLLWDGAGDPRAELRWCLSRLRPLVDDDAATRIAATRERVRFDACGASVDVVDLRALLGNDPARVPVQTLKAAAARFRGTFLEGLELADGHRFNAWCAAEREAARALHASVLAALVERLRDRPEDALRYARLRVQAEPFSGAAHAAVIRLLAEAGRSREALEHYDRCRPLLSRELGAPPRELCIFEAPDAEALRQAFRAAGLPFERVWAAELITEQPAARLANASR